jgi:hypothetical protein
MPGSTSANFHEGSRSEYLAQYAFASLGTAVAVPHQEDTGLDIYCTVTERIGQEIWPQAYFSVQVKSTATPWKFSNQQSVRWLIEHPLPIFLCIVNKAALELQVYHTCPRFYAWSLPPLPETLELNPGPAGEGTCVQWDDGNSYSLSAPILAFNISQIHDEDFRKKVKEVLRFWIQIEEQNLRRVKNKILQFSMPGRYTTNTKGDGSVIRHWSSRPREEEIREAISLIEPQLTWLAQTLWTSGDVSGAVRAALLHRYWFKDSRENASVTLNSLGTLNSQLGKKLEKNKYVFEAIDWLGAALDKELKKPSR